MPLAPEIITITEQVRVSDLARVVPVRVVTYRLGEHGPYTLTIPEAEFTVDEVQRRLREAADRLIALLPAE